MIIESVDAHDDAAFAEWFGPFHAAEMATWPGQPGWAEHEMRVLYRDASDSDPVVIVARDTEGRAVGSLDVSFPKLESLHLAYVLLAVHPDSRGRGVGRALVEHAEEMVRERGRTSIIASTDEPAVGQETRSSRFARAAGYEAARVDHRRRLMLPLDDERLSGLETAAAPFAHRYRIITWVGSCADELAAGRAELSRVISADAPHGDLDYEAEEWDVERLRNWERNVVEMNRYLVAAGAIELATGELVGFTEMGLPRGEPRVAYQLDTVVAGAHRGHRLGMLLKIANIRALVAMSPATEEVHTWNAASNDPMISVNEAMGYELIGIVTSWQKQLRYRQGARAAELR